MLLTSVTVDPFKSINSPQTVEIEDGATVFVGMNEAGKTVFLRALEKSDDAVSLAKFDPVEDYPRKDLPAYLRKHAKQPAAVTNLKYLLSDDEVLALNNEFHTKISANFSFSVSHGYDNKKTIGLKIDERPAIAQLLSKNPALSSDTKSALKGLDSLDKFAAALEGRSLTEEEKAFLATIEARVGETPDNWSTIQWEVWSWISERLPKFLYFGEYEVLPSKMNLADLATRVAAAKSDPKQLQSDHRSVLALLRMADIDITDFTKTGGYETLKAKIEGVSINLTDQIMNFWKQNEDLEVEIDIKPDPEDSAPYNNGPNLYLRIKNRRHRGVSTPFRQRSRGFIWFFSFLVWFDSVQDQLASKTAGNHDLILLLDEPGLSLHARAQEDFLRYIETLCDKHQVLYTTHSPFMVKSDELKRVRLVEDRANAGTVISDTGEGSDPRTLFPLQAALGWTIAQNLFISKRNLIVEGPSELVYLQFASSVLEAKGRTGLRDDITIVPAGGLDKVATFVALLGANGLELAVFHDYRGAPEQRLIDLVKQKMISPKALLNASQFRDEKKFGSNGVASDIEDLFDTGVYFEYFCKTFQKKLPSGVEEKDLPPGDRIVERIERFLKTKSIEVRPSGGFNHYAVASHFVGHPPSGLSPKTLDRFEALFKSVNALFA